MAGHPLDEITVFDPDNAPIRLGRVRSGRTTVFVFVRQFGCLFCRQLISDVRSIRDRIAATGSQVIVIGHGTVQDARTFRDEIAGALPVFTDPTREAYCAVGLRRGVATVFRPAVFFHALRARWKGFVQTHVAGDPLQQGGVVILDAAGAERYRYISRVAGDHPPMASLLGACVAAAGRS